MAKYFGVRREVITHCATEGVTAWSNTTKAALCNEKEALAILSLSDVSIPLVLHFYFFYFHKRKKKKQKKTSTKSRGNARYFA